MKLLGQKVITESHDIDFEVLAKYKEGIIVSSACPSGIIAKAIELGELGMAKKYIKWFKEQFGDDYYIEVMPHNPTNQSIEIY
jgi:DNA polymerase-3 subunit alpha